MPIRPPIEEQLTIAPLSCSRIWRSSYFMQFQTPRRLIALTRSNSSPLASAVSTAGDCHLSLVGDIATDGDRLMAGGDQFLYCKANRVLMDVRQRHGSPSLREGFGGR
jgi:hypothetical protein